MKISSKDNPLIKYLIDIFNNKKMRDSSNLFLVEGYNLVREASSLGLVKQIYSVNEEKDYKDAIIITNDLLKKITNTVTPEGIIALCYKNNNTNLSENIIYLDNIQDPGNVGTLLRSACAFNFGSVILDNSCDIYNPKVIRSSEGGIFKLSFPKISLEELKNIGYEIVSTSMNGIDINKYEHKNKKICLILGNEGRGVRKDFIEISDVNLTIPMKNIESLNVGVAGSIIMYEFSK